MKHFFYLAKINFFKEARSSKQYEPVSCVQLFESIQCKLLNVITLGQRESDNINRLITLTKQASRLVDCKNAKWALDNFNLLITLTE